MSRPFEGKGLFIDGIVFLEPREALEFLERGALLVDLRDGWERNGRDFRVPSVLLLPWEQLEQRLDELPRHRPLIIADCVGLLSKRAARLLQQREFDNIAVLNGGMVAWGNADMPVFFDADSELSGGCACRLRPGRSERRGGC